MEMPRPVGPEEHFSTEEEARPEPEPDSEKEVELSVDEGRFVTEGMKPIVPYEHSSRSTEEEPVEIKYEKRHETIGEPVQQRVVSMATLIAGLKLRKPTLSNKSSAKKDDSSKDTVIPGTDKVEVKQDEDVQTPAPGTYHQAIQAGFFVAVLLIFAFLLIQIL